MKLTATLALGALMALPMAVTPALGQEKEVRVGFLVGLEGGRGIFGNDQRDGFLLALDHLDGKLGGLPAKVIIKDTKHEPDVGVQIIDEFINKDKVHFAAGITWSNVLAAVYQKARDSKTFLISTNAGWSGLSGKECNEYFFRASWNNDDTPEAMGKSMQNLNLKNVYIMAPNYQAGKDMIAGYKRYYTGNIAGEVLYQLGQSDFQAELTQIRAAKPDAVFAFAPGGMGIALAKQHQAAGLTQSIPLYTVFAVDWMTLPAYGKAAIGNFHTSFWDSDSTIPANVRFKEDFKKKYGRNASMFAVQGYDAALLMDLGVKSAKGDPNNKEAIRDGMRTAKIDSPRGPFTFNNNHNPIQNYYRREVVAGPDGEPIIKTVETVFENHKDAYHGECSMSW